MKNCPVICFLMRADIWPTHCSESGPEVVMVTVLNPTGCFLCARLCAKMSKQGPCPCRASDMCSNETSQYRDLALCHCYFGTHSKQSSIYFISCHITRNFLSFVKRLSLTILIEKVKSPSRREAHNAINMVNHLQVFPVLHGFLGPRLYQ